MPTAKETKQIEDHKILEKLDKFFSNAIDHPTWKSWRENAVKCFKYKEGDQWTTAEKAELKKRNQPDTVNNQVKVTVDRMVGQFVKQRTRIGYRGRNSPQDEPTAKALSDIYLFIKQNTSLEFEERDMAEDGFTCGFGVLETYMSYDDLFQPEIKIRHEDPFNILPDPNTKRYNWNEDATYICRQKWVDLETAKELYPRHAMKMASLMVEVQSGVLGEVDDFKNDLYFDFDLKRIRIVEIWYKTKEKRDIALFPNGRTEELNGKNRKFISGLGKEDTDYRRIDKLESKMRVGVFTGHVLLEHKEVDRENYPFVPYFVHRKKSGEPYSLVFTALTLQDAINKRESKALHILNTNQAIYEKGSVIDKNELAEEMARPDGQIEVERNALSGAKFQIEKNVDLAVTQFSMHNEAKNDFRRVTGINPDALGERSEVRSGVGIARKQAMTDIIIAPVFDNFRRTRIILAKNVLELVQKYYTEPKIFTITDDLNATKVIPFNQEDSEGRLISAKTGIYDVIVEDMPDTTTIQQEQFQTLGAVLPQILPFGPFWTSMLIQLSDIRNKEEILKQIEEMSQPPPSEPTISISAQLNELTAMERAFFYSKMGADQLAQAVLAENKDPAHITKEKMNLIKEQLKVDGDISKGDLELQKVLLTNQGKANVQGNNN